jgi:hypothetical protein
VLALPVPIFVEAVSAPFLNSYTPCLAMQRRHTTECDSYLQHLSESQCPVTALIRHLPIRRNNATNKGHLRSGETCLWAASDLFRSFEVEQTYGQQKKRRPPEEVSNREFGPL